MDLLDSDAWASNSSPNGGTDHVDTPELSGIAASAALEQMNTELSLVQQELCDLMVDIKHTMEFGGDPENMDEWVFSLALMESRVTRINHAMWSLWKRSDCARIRLRP